VQPLLLNDKGHVILLLLKLGNVQLGVVELILKHLITTLLAPELLSDHTVVML
jgi:hypothetical protein